MPADDKDAAPRRRWNLGILSDPQTDEVPGEYRHLHRVAQSILMARPQAPSSSSRAHTTATSRWGCSMPTHAHPPRRCRQYMPAPAASPAAPASRPRRNAPKTAASSSTPSPKTRPMTRSTGARCDATWPSCLWASTAWSAVA